MCTNNFATKQEKTMHSDCAKDSGFWLVWCPQSTKSPTVKHWQREAAEAEADRLAATNPGKEYFVLAAETVFKTTAVVKQTLIYRVR